MDGLLALQRLRHTLAHDQQALARIASCSQMGATEAFNVLPAERALRINNVAFAIKLAYTLGSDKLLDYYGDKMATCSSNHCRGAALGDNGPARKRQHLLNCKAGGNLIGRHDKVKECIAQMLRTSGSYTKVEPRSTYPGTGQGGPDIIVHDFKAGKTAMIDYTMVNCYSMNHPECARTPLYMAATADKAKRVKYGPTASYMGYDILGASMETTGAFGKTLQHILLQSQSNYEQRHPDMPHVCALPKWSARRFNH